MSDKTFGQPLGGHTAGRDQGYPEGLPRFKEVFGSMTADIYPVWFRDLMRPSGALPGYTQAGT